MFEQQQNIADLFFFPQGDELLLQAKASRVVDSAELDDGDQVLFATDLRGLTGKSLHDIDTEGTEELHRSLASLRMTMPNFRMTKLNFRMSRLKFLIRVHPCDPWP